ncbi:hypothetical protein AADEFJLK_00197 [Methylovulum psychrotolerans]|uniref:Uncharacterized protein n=2 Tax=Methylovulum psychrotolerans TaxID=1704499 RepID=A0A2S5CQS4_9GAMM|nr:hypothetical protein AADEFJLK_00197 [Methylovulum psychrotolerans]
MPEIIGKASIFNTNEVEIHEINECISKKSKNIERYNQTFSEKWLIIVLPAMKMAGDLCVSDNIFTTIEHGFSNIYLLDSHLDKLFLIGNGSDNAVRPNP